MMRHYACQMRHAVVSSAWLLACLLISPASAELLISETDGIYSINLVMQMEVPAQYVHRVLTDYAHIYRLDPAIVDSEILPSADDGVVRVRTRIDGCIAFFCKKIDLVQDVREFGHNDLQTTTIPSLSSFKSGHTMWKITSIGRRTQVSYEAEMVPKFFIPPLIGGYFLKQELQERILASMARIQCIARIQAGMENNPELDPVMVSGLVTRDHATEATLLVAQASTIDAETPVVGSTGEQSTECAGPCSINDSLCQP